MFSNYDGVLKVDGEVGSKNAYDPRAWGKLSEAGIAKRVIEGSRDSALGWYIPEQVTRWSSTGSFAPAECRWRFANVGRRQSRRRPTERAGVKGWWLGLLGACSSAWLRFKLLSLWHRPAQSSAFTFRSLSPPACGQPRICSGHRRMVQSVHRRGRLAGRGRARSLA